MKKPEQSSFRYSTPAIVSPIYLLSSTQLHFIDLSTSKKKCEKLCGRRRRKAAPSLIFICMKNRRSMWLISLRTLQQFLFF